ncbi:MAG: prolipoprotein diacylglyceryl transferase, partial [Deltaproteobacteria bacterium]|nr:prolipoprotein diacylglyceryl transferase [Deltaproteobacteria bacterium]
ADRYLLACLDPERFADVHGPARLAPLTRNPDCWAALRVWEGGLVWYGGLLGALAAIWLFCWGKGALEPAARPGRPSLAVLADLFVPAAALGHAFGRLGCFAAGCCWGRPATLPWSVSFPAGSMAWNQQLEQGLIPGWADASLPVHPTQLYEAGGELLIFFFLLVGLRTGQHLRRPGQLAMTWAVLYPLLRSLVELFRADEERGALLRWGSATVAGWLGLPPGTWLLLSWGQAVSLVVASVALALLLRQQGQR